ncbi:hypothetical protein LZ3411_2283 [Levilactobacillus zymae]|uniref:Uncharacterized protein n=1 Tax=Levilactobacillus zymae TaxID=267363 RepID=A0A1Y6K2K9_9LACO|nr:hypothetical protein LZ3411_1232 [Levilactobacillus zymae]SMS15333.1 hypothetical protein LZ3411_2283 [Levilactobacillus zymae]
MAGQLDLGFVAAKTLRLPASEDDSQHVQDFFLKISGY